MRWMVLVIAALLAGCMTESTDSGQGSASVYVKDAPTDEFEEIHVVFTEVRVHATGGDGDDEDGNETSTTASNGTDAGWHVIVSSHGTDVDLLNASGDRSAFLGEADLAAGTYTQLRIVLSEAYGVKDNGTVPIFVPSGTLKLNHPFTVEAGMETRIVLDFDLDASLRETPQGWRLTPVVGSVDVQIVEDSQSGADVDEQGQIT